MLKVRKVLVAVLMFLGTAYAVEISDIKVKSAKSEKVNLDGYKTYQITKESGIINNPNNRKMDVNIVIQNIINSELENKGKVLVTENPDFLVAYSAGTDRDDIVSKVPDTIPESAMALVLIDAQTGIVIVKSTAEAEFKGLSDDKMTKRLQFAIKNMLNDI